MTAPPKPSTSSPPTVLHVFPGLEMGGAQARFVTLANALGGEVRHLALALNGRFDALAGIAADVPLERVAAEGRGLRAAMRQLRALKPGRLVTYNWGAIEWAMANRLTRTSPGLHVEDGFGPDERPFAQKRRRMWFRRLALKGATPVLVPSRLLQRVAREVWTLPEAGVLYVPNGVDTARFQSAGAAARARPVIGFVGALRREKNLPRLIEAVASLPGTDLVIVGDGPERAALESLAATQGVAARFTGARQADAALYAGFDVFALSSDTEQMPMTVLEAMACGLPVAATDVGDIAAMVAAENRPFVKGESAADLADSLAALTGDQDTRCALGAANRARAEGEFTLDAMVARWRSLLTA